MGEYAKVQVDPKNMFGCSHSYDGGISKNIHIFRLLGNGRFGIRNGRSGFRMVNNVHYIKSIGSQEYYLLNVLGDPVNYPS